MPPECTPETPGDCPIPECTSDTTCVPDDACAVGRCLDGACFFEDGGSCGAGELCFPESGCRAPFAGEWIDLGGSGTGGGVSAAGSETRNVRISIGPLGTPYLAWTDTSSGNRDIYLARWDGSSWTGVGGSTDPGGISNNPADSRWGGLVVESDTSIHAAWMDETDGRSVYYRHWDGTRWEELGGSATARGVSSIGTAWWPAMTLDDSGAPLIAWEVYAVVAGGAVHVRRWNGATWEELDSSGTGAGIAMGSATLVTVASIGPRIVVAWQEERGGASDIVLRSWAGATSWTEVGGSFQTSISATSTSSSRAHVAIDSMDRPSVLWQEETAAGTRAYLRTWSGSTWEELSGSASGDGVFPSHVPVQSARFALDPGGRPVVAWASQSASGPLQVYVARWEDPSWVLLGDPDAGISRTPGESQYPNISITPDGTLHVGWEEQLSPGNVEIYYRQLPPT